MHNEVKLVNGWYVKIFETIIVCTRTPLDDYERVDTISRMIDDGTLVAFDRADGIPYYKEFENAAVVKYIDSVLANQ